MTRSDRTSSPLLRRSAVLALYGAFALAGGLWINGGMRQTATAATILVASIAGLSAFAFLFVNTRYWRWGNAPDPDLDEFEIARRNVAYLNAYRVVGSTSMLGLLWLGIATDNGWWTPTSAGYSFVFWGWLLVVVTLPAALLAWAEREED